MPKRDVIVVGASAGGIEALTALLSRLPEDLDAAVLVVVHMPAQGGPALRQILGRAARLPVGLAADNEPLRSGRVYVSVGDFHLLVGAGRVYVRQGPRENGYRPAIDPLFRSAAVYYGPRVIGVVLSGNLSDGTAGLLAIRRQGGLAVVQDPDDAVYDSMPNSAIEEAGADHVVPAEQMGELLARLVAEEIEVADPTADRVLTTEVRLMEAGDPGEVHPGRPSPWPCPDCNGVLWEVEDGPVLRFRCRVGHAWSAESLLAQQADGVEGALWMALRALEDRPPPSPTGWWTAPSATAARSARRATATSWRAWPTASPSCAASSPPHRRGAPGPRPSRRGLAPPWRGTVGRVPDEAVTPGGPGVELVLRYLRESRLFDFTGYKRGTLTRRIDRRMQQVGAPDYDGYVDYLQVHPEEFEQLFNTILINVSSFFRDPDAWDALAATVIPEILQRHPSGPIRIWSAGCSTGQEAYTAVMLMTEHLGVDAAKDRLKVYATDLDNEALDRARQAEYSSREMESVPEELRDRYFRPSGNGFAFSADLRRSVIFGRHDLLQDAPISRTDLLICRNTLMYFNADVQSQIVNRLHFSVAEHGYLFLGKVEMLGQSDLFQPVDARYRIFQKVDRTSLRARLLAMAGRPGAASPEDARIIDLAFELRANPEILLDSGGMVLAVNARARELFGIGLEAVGRPFQDLELSYRPVELRSRIDQVRAEGRVVELDEVSRWTPSGELTYLDIKIVPLVLDGQNLGVVIAFVDVTRHRQLQQELEQTHRELEVAYEELQSANEELETTNEELQSTIEELETTNEELQSTNEELEAMNEELSSTNEELQAINDELRDRTAEVDQVNAYIESVLETLDASVIVVDGAMQVRVWNGRSFDMWGLRSDEAEGRSILALDVGFPVDVLAAPIRACLQGDDPGVPVEMEALSRRGQKLRCTARVAPLRGPERDVQGAIIIISDRDAAR